jgi:hypothetical protein
LGSGSGSDSGGDSGFDSAKSELEEAAAGGSGGESGELSVVAACCACCAVAAAAVLLLLHPGVYLGAVRSWLVAGVFLFCLEHCSVNKSSWPAHSFPLPADAGGSSDDGGTAALAAAAAGGVKGKAARRTAALEKLQKSRGLRKQRPRRWAVVQR